jgi:Domain of unknown function (DUF1918)
VQAQGLPGFSPRRGQIVEVIRAAGPVRYRVRWDEKHESICHSTEGVVVLPRGAVVPPRHRESRRVRPRDRAGSSTVAADIGASGSPRKEP